MPNESDEFKEIKETVFDVILLGTSLSHSVLASSLVQAGKKVLHLDENNVFGGPHMCLNALQFLETLVDTNSAQQNHVVVPGSASIQCHSPHNSRDYQEGDPCIIDESILLEIRSNPTIQTMMSRILNIPSQSWSDLIPEKKQISANAEKILFLYRFLKDSRSYHLEFSPKLLYASGTMIDLLIRSKIGSHLEFAQIEKIYFSNKDMELISVPGSKEDVFADKSLSLLQKRKTMKFLKGVLDHDSLESEDMKEKLQIPFKQYLQEAGIMPPMSDVITYGIALTATARSASTLPASAGITKTRQFLSSIQKYGKSPFLSGLYGTASELCQSFCRSCAVHGGIYILDCSFQSIRYDVNSHHYVMETSIPSANESRTPLSLKAKFVVSGPQHVSLFNSKETNVSSAVSTNPVGCVNRALLVSSKPYLKESGMSLVIFPPTEGDGELLPKSLVAVLQFNEDNKTTRSDNYLIHVVSLADTDGEQDVQHVMKLITETLDGTEATWIECRWKQHIHQLSNPVSVSSGTGNLFVLTEQKLTIDVDAFVTDAEYVFKQIVPDEPFLKTVERTTDEMDDE